MADETTAPAPGRSRLPLIGGAALLVALIAGAWAWVSAGKQSTDDAQVEGTSRSWRRVSAEVVEVSVADNQHVEAVLSSRGSTRATIRWRWIARAPSSPMRKRPRPPQAQECRLPWCPSRTHVSQATGGVEEAQAGIGVADSQVESAKSQLVAAQARLREREATATKNAKDVERLKLLVAKEEISQQQFDATVATSDAARAAADAAKSEIAAAETAIATAQQRAVQARAAVARAEATLQTTKTAPEQIQAMRARASAAEARVKR